MKIFSDACQYGLRATFWLAQRPEQPHKVREIAAETRASPGYLVKVLQRLAKAGILSTQRGAQGGFTLKRDPSDLTVLEIINAIDSIERIQTCPLGIDSHGENLCPLHRQLDGAMALIEDALGSITVATLLSEQTSSPSHCTALRQAGRSIRKDDREGEQES